MTPQQLRNSILQMAIEGKLTEQRAEDGNASDLLKEIKAEKAKLIAEKKIKKEKPLPEISEDEIPFEIPDNWVWCYINIIPPPPWAAVRGCHSSIELRRNDSGTAPEYGSARTAPMFAHVDGISGPTRNRAGRFGLFYRGFGGGLLRLRFSIVSEFFLNHSFTSFFNSYRNNCFKIILI